MNTFEKFYKKNKALLIALFLVATAVAATFMLFYVLIEMEVESSWAHALSCVGGVLAAGCMCLLPPLFRKYRELISYLFFGVVTTIVNFVVYFVIRFVAENRFGAQPEDHYLWINMVAWVAAVLVAYVTNRRWVFANRATGFLPVLGEFCAFILSRLFSFGVEQLLLWIFVDAFHMNDVIAKCIVAVVTIILNYITSKLLVFRKTKKTGSAKTKAKPKTTNSKTRT